MNFEQLINNMTPEMVTSLKRAIEIGKWPDGKLLTMEQKETCMEAVISYEHCFVEAENRVGFIDRGSKADGDMCGDDSPSSEHRPESPTPLKWS